MCWKLCAVFAMLTCAGNCVLCSCAGNLSCLCFVLGAGGCYVVSCVPSSVAVLLGLFLVSSSPRICAFYPQFHHLVHYSLPSLTLGYAACAGRRRWHCLSRLCARGRSPYYVRKSHPQHHLVATACPALCHGPHLPVLWSPVVVCFFSPSFYIVI